jgi:hypothetical protein
MAFVSVLNLDMVLIDGLQIRKVYRLVDLLTDYSVHLVFPIVAEEVVLNKHT